MIDTTLLEHLIDPQVISTMVSAELKEELRVTGFYRVDRTLTGRAGSTITVPTWKFIGPAEHLPENQRGRVTQMETNDVSYTVLKAVKNVLLTDEAVLSGLGDPVGEAVQQLRLAIQDRMDWDGVELLQGINASNGHVLELASGNITYEDVINASHMLKRYKERQRVDRYLLAHNETVKRIRKSPQFTDVPGALRDRVIETGAVGALAGAGIIISDKLSTTEAYLLTPQCLTVFMKRDINVERLRDVLYKGTLISSDCHYVVAIENYDRLVAMRWKE